MSRLHLLAAPLLLLSVAGCEQPEPPKAEAIRPVRALMVADATEFEGRTFPGRAQAAQEVELSFRVAGRLNTLPIVVGAEVAVDSAIATLDPRDYEVEVQNVRAQLEQARAVARRAEADLARLQGVRDRNPDFVSQIDYDAAVQARDSGRANVAALEASLRAAQARLEDTTLQAPFSGIVVDVYVENFEEVRVGQPIARIVDDSRIEFVVNIPENLIALAPQVDSVQVAFDALPGTVVQATIKEIGTEASSTTRTYPVTLAMDQPPGARILPGMVGKASGRPPEGVRATGVEVPVTSLFAGTDDEGSTYVWVFDPAASSVTRRAVELGELRERGQLVTGGLSAGEWVVTAGVNYLREGQTVRLLNSMTEAQR